MYSSFNAKMNVIKFAFAPVTLQIVSLSLQKPHGLCPKYTAIKQP